jgi:hypothetical protein
VPTLEDFVVKPTEKKISTMRINYIRSHRLAQQASGRITLSSPRPKTLRLKTRKGKLRTKLAVSTLMKEFKQLLSVIVLSTRKIIDNMQHKPFKQLILGLREKSAYTVARPKSRVLWHKCNLAPGHYRVSTSTKTTLQFLHTIVLGPLHFFS